MKQKQHIIHLALLCVSSLSLVSCGLQHQWGTASGSPEALISGGDPQSKVISRMVSKRWNIEKQSRNLITFERQQVTPSNSTILAMSGIKTGGSPTGITDGWNITFVPQGGKTRTILGSTYVKTKQNGTTSSSATRAAGDEFISTLRGL